MPNEQMTFHSVIMMLYHLVVILSRRRCFVFDGFKVELALPCKCFVPIHIIIFIICQVFVLNFCHFAFYY